MGLGCVVFSLRTRMPITMAWSTPGAALLAATATPAGGWPAAVGAFVVTGLLLALLALVRPLARLVAAIPDELAAAMLAGVLLVLCVAPFRALTADPAVIAPVVLAWLVGFVLIRRWAVPIALAVALLVMLAGGTLSEVGAGDLAPVLDVAAGAPARPRASRSPAWAGRSGGLSQAGLCSWPCAVVTKTWLPGPDGRGEPLAEDMGFEPMRGFIPNTISNRAH